MPVKPDSVTDNVPVGVCSVIVSPTDKPSSVCMFSVASASSAACGNAPDAILREGYIVSMPSFMPQMPVLTPFTRYSRSRL